MLRSKAHNATQQGVHVDLSQSTKPRLLYPSSFSCTVSSEPLVRFVHYRVLAEVFVSETAAHRIPIAPSPHAKTLRLRSALAIRGLAPSETTTPTLLAPYITSWLLSSISLRSPPCTKVRNPNTLPTKVVHSCSLLHHTLFQQHPQAPPVAHSLPPASVRTTCE